MLVFLGDGAGVGFVLGRWDKEVEIEEKLSVEICEGWDLGAGRSSSAIQKSKILAPETLDFSFRSSYTEE